MLLCEVDARDFSLNLRIKDIFLSLISMLKLKVENWILKLSLQLKLKVEIDDEAEV